MQASQLLMPLLGLKLKLGDAFSTKIQILAVIQSIRKNSQA